MTVISLENYIKELKKTRREINAWAISKAEEIASKDMTALIAERVQDSGVDESGSKFSPYSEQYKKLRRKKGRETAFKDFTLTTEMWRKFGIVSSKTTNKDITIRLGGKNRDSQIKINVNSQREGVSIIGISKKEETIILKTFEEELFKFLQRRL